MKRLRQVFRAKWSACRRAWKAVFVVIRRHVGFNELLGILSLGLVAWGVGLMWLPLAPLIVGLAGLAVAVINARMR